MVQNVYEFTVVDCFILDSLWKPLTEITYITMTALVVASYSVVVSQVGMKLAANKSRLEQIAVYVNVRLQIS